jgi:hypothetical protein
VGDDLTPEHVFYVVLICASVLGILGLLFWSVGERECLPVDETDSAGDSGLT